MPIDDGLLVTPATVERKSTVLRFYGGPFGMRTYQLPHVPWAGLRIVMKTDAKGQRIRPIVYEVVGPTDRDEKATWTARHAGFATDADLEAWAAGPPKP